MNRYSAGTPRTIRLASLLLRCGGIALLILRPWLPVLYWATRSSCRYVLSAVVMRCRPIPADYRPDPASRFADPIGRRSFHPGHAAVSDCTVGGRCGVCSGRNR